LAVPALTSTASIAVVFLPLVLVGSRAGLELAGPMAVAVLAGLITTTLLAFVVMPALYLRWGRVTEFDTTADDLMTAFRPLAANT
jgi:Cu/Ag efflux pump CusA